MAYDYLKETTFSKDLEQQEQMIDYLSNRSTEQTDDIQDVDPDLVEIMAQEPEDEPEEAPAEEQEQFDFDKEEDDNTDMELLSFLFSEKEGDAEGAGNLRNTNRVVNINDVPNGLEWLKAKSANVKFQSLDQNISKYLNTLPDNLRKGLVATSGNDDKHAKGSKHYDNQAIDLRFDDKVYNFIQNDPVFQQLGLKVLDPNHGTAPHIHIEKKQFGGKTLFADSEEVQRIGLNDPNYNKAVLNLVGTNTIRGLDNNQPVAVTDGSKYKVLKNKYDTAKFHGKVYEQKL